jgi:GST-like protein
MNPFTLHGRPGWGSAIIEAQLAWYGLPYRYVDSGDLFASAPARDALRPLNPLAQVPVLVAPNGEVLTESAAITLHLADLADHDDLVPGPKAPERGRFLRWLVFVVANVYPTFTYADEPTRFVKTEGASEGFKQEVDAYAQRLWAMVEAAAGEPHFLGARLSALDLYLAVMIHWRPRRAWFEQHAPKLAAAAAHACALPPVAPVIERNFPKKG